MKPYIKEINQNTSDSHQTSPHWLITFVRFNTRDTFNFGVGFQGKDKEPVRKYLVVENDCISVNVSTSKKNRTPQATLTLLGGDLNYSTAVSPGDFFTVNIVDSSDKARELRIKVDNKKPINEIHDGFKGIFKVNSVNKIMMVDPGSGRKVLRYQVTGYAFTEFNNLIYYNPIVTNETIERTFLYGLNTELTQILTSKGNIQEVLSILPTLILGKSLNSDSFGVTWIKKNPYEVPKKVFDLLGIEGSYAIDLYKIMLGIWGGFKNNTNKENEGFEPEYEENGQYQILKKPITGTTPVQTTSLQNISLFDLLNRFLNDIINEMYTCFRVDKNTQKVIPKIIIRQKPFTTLHGKHEGNQIEDTKFLELPRWKISPDLIYNINVSKNESLRFNFVQIVGVTGDSKLDANIIADQASNPLSIKFDDNDIKRHGLRPYVKTCNFDFPIAQKISQGPYWTSLVFDWVHGGHLKLNGKIECVGIEDNICIGDNLELGNTVFHIEDIQHTAAISPDGKKMFKTFLTVSNGVDKRSSKQGPVYPEMDFTDTLTDRIDDYNSGDKILPGFSDTQDILGRTNGEELKETKERTFSKKYKKKE